LLSKAATTAHLGRGFGSPFLSFRRDRLLDCVTRHTVLPSFVKLFRSEGMQAFVNTVAAAQRDDAHLSTEIGQNNRDLFINRILLGCLVFDTFDQPVSRTSRCEIF
jgi:hypothetical protein